MFGNNVGFHHWHSWSFCGHMWLLGCFSHQKGTKIKICSGGVIMVDCSGRRGTALKRVATFVWRLCHLIISLESNEVESEQINLIMFVEVKFVCNHIL